MPLRRIADRDASAPNLRDSFAIQWTDVPFGGQSALSTLQSYGPCRKRWQFLFRAAIVRGLFIGSGAFDRDGII